MTVINIGDGVFIGFVTDAKPWPSENNKGFRYIEFVEDYSKFTTWLCDGVRWLAQSDFAETWTNKTIDYNLNNMLNFNNGSYIKDIDPNTTGLFIVLKRAGVDTEVQIA